MDVPKPLVIFENDEPADAVQLWMEDSELQNDDFRATLIDRVCDGHLSQTKDLVPHCRRRSPIILQVPLTDESGRNLGLFTLLADEEVADAAYSFAARNGLSPAFRQMLRENMCNREGTLCSRKRGKACDRPVAKAPEHGQGNYDQRVLIWEDEEPADAVYRFAENVGLPLWYRQSIIFSLCNDRELGLTCTRPIPAVFSLPLTDETGKDHGQVHVLEGERPVDALHLFMKGAKPPLTQIMKHPGLRHRLFGRLCGAAADEGVDLDCSITEPRLMVTSVEITYNGIKSNLNYYHPDDQDPCLPISRFDDIEAESEEEERSGCLNSTRAAVAFFCERLSPIPGNCFGDIHGALLNQLRRDDTSRWDKVGPVGIDYYQMLRLPSDADTARVEAAIQHHGKGVVELFEDVAKRTQVVVDTVARATSSYITAELSLAAMNSSLDAARTLLSSAYQSLATAKSSMASVVHAQSASTTALNATRSIVEALRQRLLAVCNDTIVRRNCTRHNASALQPEALAPAAEAEVKRLKRRGQDVDASSLVADPRHPAFSWWQICLRYGERYEDAAQGCDLLEAGKFWICPDAEERLSGLLPRYPIDITLEAANGQLESWSAAMGATAAALNATRRTTFAAKKLIEAGRSSGAIASAAMQVAKMNFNAANKTAAGLNDGDMEKASSRSFALKRATEELVDETAREFYDKPCKPVFGACCARDQADGGMSIICG